MKSLQEFCRSSILRAVTIERLDQIDKLPLPKTLKADLSVHTVQRYFDTDGEYLSYNFSFPHHPHHETHSVHPARCTFNGKIVLIVKQHNPKQICERCNLFGVKLDHCPKRWVKARHPSLQKCLIELLDEGTKATCFILEYPLFSLGDVICKLSDSGVFLPEFMLWDLIYQMTSVAQYLKDEGEAANFEPCNFVITGDGRVKMENLLLYLPGKGKACPRRPGKIVNLRGEHTSRGNDVLRLVSTLFELATLSPAFFFAAIEPQTWNTSFLPTPSRIPAHYSKDMKMLLTSCFGSTTDMWSYQSLNDIAAKNMNTLAVTYGGPSNILDFISKL